MDSEEEEEEEEGPSAKTIAGTSAAVKRAGEENRGRTRRPMKRVKYTFSDSEEDKQGSSDDELFELD